MDPDQIAQRVRARFEYSVARQVMREKYQAKMLFAHAGGMWRAGPDLICLLQSCPDESSVIEDLYGNPVLVDVSDMLMLAQQRWQEQMNQWLIEYQELSRQR